MYMCTHIHIYVYVSYTYIRTTETSEGIAMDEYAEFLRDQRIRYSLITLTLLSVTKLDRPSFNFLSTISYATLTTEFLHLCFFSPE